MNKNTGPYGTNAKQSRLASNDHVSDHSSPPPGVKFNLPISDHQGESSSSPYIRQWNRLPAREERIRRSPPPRHA